MGCQRWVWIRTIEKVSPVFELNCCFIDRSADPFILSQGKHQHQYHVTLLEYNSIQWYDTILLLYSHVSSLHSLLPAGPHPTTLLDYDFCPARCHRRHCPPTTATGHYRRPSSHHPPSLIPFRLPARALPLSLSSHYHEIQWISLADVNGTLYMSDEDICKLSKKWMILRRMGGELCYVTFRVSFLYHFILILPHLFYRWSDDRGDGQPGACAMETLLTMTSIL